MLEEIEIMNDGHLLWASRQTVYISQRGFYACKPKAGIGPKQLVVVHLQWFFLLDNIGFSQLVQ